MEVIKNNKNKSNRKRRRKRKSKITTTMSTNKNDFSNFGLNQIQRLEPRYLLLEP